MRHRRAQPPTPRNRTNSETKKHRYQAEHDRWLSDLLARAYTAQGRQAAQKKRACHVCHGAGVVWPSKGRSYALSRGGYSVRSTYVKQVAADVPVPSANRLQSAQEHTKHTASVDIYFFFFSRYQRTGSLARGPLVKPRWTWHDMLR